MISGKPLIIAAALLVLAACNRENVAPENSSKAISIQASIGTMSKVTTTGADSRFEEGDRIVFYAWTGSKTEIPAARVVDGVDVTYTRGIWEPATPTLWADMVSEHFFLGVSPARSIGSLTADPFTVDPADYAASDLLIATELTGLKATDNPVKLVFDHAMARLQVNLNFRNQWGGTPAVSAVTASAAPGGTVDYLSKTVTAGASGSLEIPALDSPSEGHALSFDGLIIPQEGFRTVTVTVEGQDFVYTHTEDIKLLAGKVTVVNLVIGRDSMDIGSDVTINPWTSQGEAIGGDVFKPAN